MAEYIKKEAAMDIVRRTSGDYAAAFAEIRRLPAADVAPVRHGRWLCVDTDTEQFFLCNRCEKKEYWESEYCPNCGCRMDGGAD